MTTDDNLSVLWLVATISAGVGVILCLKALWSAGGIAAVAVGCFFAPLTPLGVALILGSWMPLLLIYVVPLVIWAIAQALVDTEHGER